MPLTVRLNGEELKRLKSSSTSNRLFWKELEGSRSETKIKDRRSWREKDVTEDGVEEEVKYFEVVPIRG